MTLGFARQPLRVLGIDPGLTRCGLGVVEGVPGKPPRLVAVEVVRTPSGDDVAARLLTIEEEIERWLSEYRPDAVAVERVFSQHNVRTVMGTAQAGAVAIVCAARRGLPVALHTPSEVKAAVTGSGRADKDQVTTMVTRLLRMPDRPRPADAADALALAICHLWRGSGMDLRRAALPGAKTPGAYAPSRGGRRGIVSPAASEQGGIVSEARGAAVPGSRSDGGATREGAVSRRPAASEQGGSA